MTVTQLTYFGILRAPTSWAKVCRELVHALAHMDVDLNVFERKGFLYDATFDIPDIVEERIDNQFRDDVVFTFEHPSTYHMLEGKFKVGILTYESTVVPPLWIEEANKHLDLLLVSSTFCRDIFVQCGMDDEKIDILHYGYDPEIYTPSGPKRDLSGQTQKNFKFLAVASPHKRKGLETLLQAYRNAFTKDDDVVLLVKINYVPKKKGKPFEYRDIHGMFSDYRKDASAPEVLLMDTFFSEQDIAALYRSANCLVSATRGEGFGMVYLEALACGLPVMVTGWSGHMDFLNHQNATLVEYRLRTAGEIQYDCNSKKARIAEPDVHDFSRKLFLAMKNPKTIRYAPAEERFQWRHLARHFLETIDTHLAKSASVGSET